jgi:hypothetical protein
MISAGIGVAVHAVLPFTNIDVICFAGNTRGANDGHVPDWKTWMYFGGEQRADAVNSSAGCVHAASTYGPSLPSVNTAMNGGKHLVTPSDAVKNAQASFRCVSNQPWNCFAPSGVVRTCILMRVPLR